MEKEAAEKREKEKREKKREVQVMPKTAKYPVEKRGASYQRYLAKLRRRSKWKKRARRPKRAAVSKAPVIIVEKKTKRILVEKPKPISVAKRATMKEIATMRRAMGISSSKARRLLRMAQRTQQPEYKPKKKKKIWLPRTVIRGLR